LQLILVFSSYHLSNVAEVRTLRSLAQMRDDDFALHGAATIINLPLPAEAVAALSSFPNLPAFQTFRFLHA
jgi:hypothetical protein